MFDFARKLLVTSLLIQTVGIYDVYGDVLLYRYWTTTLSFISLSVMSSSRLEYLKQNDSYLISLLVYIVLMVSISLTYEFDREMDVRNSVVLMSFFMLIATFFEVKIDIFYNDEEEMAKEIV